MVEIDKDEITTKLRQWMIDYGLMVAHLNFLELEYRKMTSGPGLLSSVNVDGMPHGNMVRNTLKDLTKIPIIEEDIEDTKRILNEMNEVFDAVNIGNSKQMYSRVLKGYYVDGKGVSDLAKELNLSTVTISTYKKQAAYNFYVIVKGKQATDSFKIL